MKRNERPGEERRDEERQAEAERIGGEQAGAAPDRLLGAGDEEHGPEHRADARRPADGEGEANDIGADRAGRMALHVDARFAVQERDLEHAEKMQPHDDDDDAAEERQDFPVAATSRPIVDAVAPSTTNTVVNPRTKASAENVTMRRATGSVPSPVNWSRLTPGHVAEIGRHQRQHARRHERQETGGEGASMSDVDRHWLRLSLLRPGMVIGSNGTTPESPLREEPGRHCRIVGSRPLWPPVHEIE